MNQYSPDYGPIHVYVPGCANDPREEEDIPGVVSALRAARARVEWRLSLPMLDMVIAEFGD